ncbi:MAG: hypothetical protein LBS66_04075, partial [Rhodospirillaceae bacterium]|nr:hypothetical protein [Rhodospirillaceae bacterium]
MKLNLGLLSISLLAGMASVVQAEGLYVGIQGGVTFSKDNDFLVKSKTEHINEYSYYYYSKKLTSYKSTTKAGYTLLATIGYEPDFLNFTDRGSIRPEFELSYRYNPYDKI